MSALNRRTTAPATGRRDPPFSRMSTASVSPLTRFSKASLAMLSKRVCANTRLSRSSSHSIRPPARSASAGRVRVTNWNARTSAWRESSPAIDLSLRLPKPAISTGHHHGSLRSACGDLSGRPNLTRTVRAGFRRRTSLSRRSAMMLPSLLGRHTLSSSTRLTISIRNSVAGLTHRSPSAYHRARARRMDVTLRRPSTSCALTDGLQAIRRPVYPGPGCQATGRGRLTAAADPPGSVPQPARG